jgi:hypothetical protein
MRQIGCYRGLAEHAETEFEVPGSARARFARALAGLLFIGSVGVLYVWPLALLAGLGVPNFVLWPLAAAGLWLGLSHLVAAATSYRGCPEVGAIASLLLGRRVITTCKPWERLDDRLEGRPRRAGSSVSGSRGADGLIGSR